MKFLSISHLQKWKLELEKTLIREYESKKNLFSSKEKAVFKEYQNRKSLAGMETFLVLKSEIEYFEELEKFILSESEMDISPQVIQEEIIESLKSDFGEEDFRYLPLERKKFTVKELVSEIRQMQISIRNSMRSLNPDLIYSRSGLEHYYKASGNPAVMGSNVKFTTRKTPKTKLRQLEDAKVNLELAWKEGFDLYNLLTNNIVLVQSPELVSYSHFIEPGISYINLLDRDLLETIDDLLHENSHHHLNLILKKYKIFKKKNSEMIYFSPWRNSLRSLYAILHAVFTFSFGARLFLHILHSEKKFHSWKDEYKERTAFRFLEETIMLSYSLVDLKNNHDSFTPNGQILLEKLIEWNRENEENSKSILRFLQKKDLKNKIYSLQKTLKFAKTVYRSNGKDGYSNRKSQK